MDACKMPQRFHLRNRNLSPRIPRTVPNGKGVLLEDKTSAMLKNFSICDQVKLFVADHDSNIIENSHDGSENVYHKQITGSELNGGELKGDLATINNLSNSLLPSAKEIHSVNIISASTMIPSKQNTLKSIPDNALSGNCDLKFNPLFEPKCHFCGLFGFLRCTQCKQVYYCSVACQKKDWQKHSVVCKKVQLNTDKAEDNPKPSIEIKNKENVVSVNTNKTVEQCKKTMISDLGMLELRKNMKVEGTVTEFLNPHEFYIQIKTVEVQTNIRKLSKELKNQVGINLNEYFPIKGEVGIAQSSLDQNWYRVLIKEVDILKKNGHVLYIDYGNEDNIPLNKIKQLPKDIAQLPPCAAKCSVENALFVKEKWNAVSRNTVAPRLKGMRCFLTITNILRGEIPCFIVDVTLPDSGKHLHDMLLEIENVLNLKNVHIEMGNSTTGSANKSNIQENKCESKDHSDCLTPKVISLSIGDSFWGLVSHIQTPGDFFCQQIKNGSKLSKLQVSLNEHCEKISTMKDFSPAIGEMCCAQFTDQQWYRALVLSFVSENTVLVDYVDYGNVEVLDLCKLRPIVPELMELPAQAIRCTLSGVKPVSETWSTEATSVMKKLFHNKVVIIKVLTMKENNFVVEITDDSMTPIINVSSYLLKSGYAVEESPAAVVTESRTTTSEEMSGQKLDQLDASWVTLTAKQVADVIVCVLFNPSEFYCQVYCHKDLVALEELNLSLMEYCEKAAPCVSKITKGELCCAYYSADGRWYRALVKDDASIEVQFVDYGNCEKVTLDKMRPISATFMKLPFQAIRCCLSGVCPINKEWSNEATAALQKWIVGKKLQAKVVSSIKNSAEIELTDNTTGSPILINDILVNEHLAFKKELMLNKKMPSVELAHDFQEMSLNVEWTTVKFAVGETVSVRVLDVINPELFYVMPTKPKVDLQELHKLMTELADFCSFQNGHPLKPKVGEPCCARFSGDNKWYRALVLRILVSEVKVVNADYGNVEVLPFSRLLPITSTFLELPFQILKCSLAGITAPATEKIKSLLFNECVIITVKGVNKNIHEVTIQKNCENRTLETADEMVIENSVCCISGNQCAEKDKFCFTDWKKRVVKLEKIVNFLLKDRFGEDEPPEIAKFLEQ
ncbi:tudor domain-containing protein 1 isoform X2 [Anolis carolinensis]|uniref:tudor domain-containing protein 1 isoform X2 n=1 Tax=Anolis carolinensis TaxID=28377 RepID=UPI002F2B8B29